MSVAELKRIKCELIPDDELQLAKDQLSASLLLGLEDSSVHAGNLASCEIIHGRQISVEETLLNLEKVTVEDILDLADEFFKTENIALVGLGNFKGVKIERERLKL